MNLDRIDFHDLLDESDSDEEEIARRRNVKVRNNLFEELDDIEFQKRFRINKHTFEHLVNRLDGVIEPVNNRNQPVSKVNQILICLRYYATGSFEINIGDHFNISQPTVSRIIKKVTRQIAALRPEYIKMPNSEEEQRDTVLKFYNLARLPGIIGALDCSHVKIQSPGGNIAEVYRNRKGYFSINSQVVGNADLKILDIVARWPGSVHDTTIFNDSNIRGRFENNEFSPYSLVGDAGYPCRSYLLTPLEPHTPPQQRYNLAQVCTRNPVERLFGVWKRRFPCLSLGMRVEIATVCEIIVATAVLHNICIEAKDNVEAYDGPEIDDIGIVPYNILRDQNTITRDTLIATVFTN